MTRPQTTRSLCLSLGFALALIGCKGRDQAAQSGCDQARLASLAATLEAAEPDARVALVSAGLLEACADQLNPTVQRMLTEITKPGEVSTRLSEDPAMRTAIERICPAHAQIGEIMAGAERSERAVKVAELCGFARYALLSDAELRELSGHGLFVWVTHDALLESGTPPEVAKTISKALFRVHEELATAVLIRPLDDQHLVAVPAAAPLREGPVVYLSPSQLVFNERPLAALEDGRLSPYVVRNHLVVPLYEQLAEETEKMVAVLGEERRDRVVVLAVDGGVHFASVVDTLYTAGRLDYQHFDFVVEPTYPVRRTIRVDPPIYTDDDAPAEEIPGEPPPPRTIRPSFKVFILDDGYRVSGNFGGESVVLPKLDARWDHAGLAKLVRERVERDPRLKRGVVSAENHIEMGVVLETYATLLGPDCEQHEPNNDCWLPELIIEAGAG